MEIAPPEQCSAAYSARHRSSCTTERYICTHKCLNRHICLQSWLAARSYFCQPCTYPRPDRFRFHGFTGTAYALEARDHLFNDGSSLPYPLSPFSSSGHSKFSLNVPAPRCNGGLASAVLVSLWKT